MFKPFLTKWPFLFKLRLFWLLFLLLAVIALFYFKIVPFGSISYHRSWPSGLRSGQGFILNPSPKERVEIKSGQPLRLIGDPVYFSLATPRTFNQAEVIVTYQADLASTSPLIEAGVLVDKLVWRYDLKPLENRVLDELEWMKLSEGSLALWQKEAAYQTLDFFLADLARGDLVDCPDGPGRCLAVYNINPDFPDQAVVSAEPAQPLEISQPLRGAHQLYVESAGQALRIELDLVDLNQDKAPDPVSLNLYQAGKLVDSQFLDDPNLEMTSGRLVEKSLSLEHPDAAGVYKVEIKASDDIVIKRLLSSSQKLSFINRLWPVSGSGSLDIYTDAAYLQAKAYTPASLQTIDFGGQPLPLIEAYEQYEGQAPINNSVNLIRLERDDVILETDGVFAFSPEAILNPSLPRVSRYFRLSPVSRYILADYQTPSDQGQWKQARAVFNLVGAYREKGKYSFVLSIPGLKAGSGQSLLVKEIRVNLSGRTLWQKLFN